MKLHKLTFRARQIFCRQPRSKISSASEPTRIMTRLHRLSIQLNKSLTRLKTALHETAQAYFSSSTSLFADNLDQKLALVQNLLGF